MENKIHVPDHQPALNGYLWLLMVINGSWLMMVDHTAISITLR
jgi:hypothetical protein